MMKLRVHGATDVGLVREQNEDSFVVDPGHDFFAVADGLGGLPGGEVASRAAVAALREQLAKVTKNGPLDLPALIAGAHAAVRTAGRAFGGEGIGTTLTVAHLGAGGVATIGHVGDSFALLVRGGRCRAITREHNIENERGLLDPTIQGSAYRYALTRVVGTPEPVRPEFFEEALRAGDRLLLVTDGLTDMVEQAAIALICGRHDEPAACAQALIQAALDGGGRDNITTIVIAVDQI